MKSLRLRMTAVVAGMVSLGAVLAGCGSSTTVAQSPPTPSALTIGLATGQNMNWWPPIQSATACGNVVGGGGINGPESYMPLLWVNRHDNINLSRSIASGIQVSQNDTVFTIHLNSKWHWSNGQPVTASDVAYDADLVLAAAQKSSPLTYCFTGTGGVPTDWKSVTAEGAHTVVITTTKSVNPIWFEHNGLSQLVPIPKKTWDRYSNVDQELHWIQSISDSPSNPVYQVVDGPYRVAQAVHNQHWTYVANPQYDGSKPKVKKVTYEYEPSASALLGQLKSGEVAYASLPFSLYQSASDIKGYHVVHETFLGYSDIAINFRSNAASVGPLLNHLYIRQALQMGIDQASYIQSMYHGLGVQNYGPVSKEPSNPYYDPTLKNPDPYNPAKGRKLLEAHGWHLVKGVMEKNGQKLTMPMLYASGSVSFQRIAQVLQQSWAKEGIQVTLSPKAPQNLSTIIGTPSDSNQWALAGGLGWGYGPDYYPSGGGLFATNSGYNLGAYHSPTMNRLIADTYLGGTSAQLKSRFDAYEVYTSQQLPVLWMPNKDDLEIVSNQLKGFRQNWNTIQQYVPANRLSFK
ncbi:peptide ABC transporter substrate-binding protein [Sulfobacillus harzensis]|uniref:Peptide ABC transporter substrate-binding protein n=1 Tax=Sulfobacillus harzensis TaxID=2729629 RepID=A0A7Y0L3P8_9FIRM|nr:peptide ABC transporter substrate-binding protein [Sulfobacillus harzensis]NMP22754.1 peptide ABC transporter substrate-binding protein [Sulfobacillus harzensis]